MSNDWLSALKSNPRLLPGAQRTANGGMQILALLEQYHASERLPPPTLSEQQRSLLATVARHAAAQSPHFAQRITRAGRTPDELAAPGGLGGLAPLTRRELVAAGPDLFCRATPPEHGPVSATSTSGSTGEPVTVRRTYLGLLHWTACTMREHLWHERDFGGRLAVLRASLRAPVSRPDWGPPAHLLVRTGPGAAMPARSSEAELVQWLSEFRPDYLLALPSSLGGIIAHLERNQTTLPEVRGIRTLSETVSDRLRRDVHRVLGLNIVDMYSSQEGGLMATQCPESGTYHVSESILLEVIDDAGRPCAPGTTGRILVTDLLNFATPLIRYEIGDFAEVAEPCACGRGLPSIRRFLGRERNLVLLPDGTKHWPTVGFHRWAEVFPVRQFQFVQVDRNTIEARMSAAARPSPSQEERLAEIIAEELHHPFAIRFHWQEAPLARGPGGKFEEFICRAV